MLCAAEAFLEGVVFQQLKNKIQTPRDKKIDLPEGNAGGINGTIWEEN